jgi:filamentous hemagglutinin family protein
MTITFIKQRAYQFGLASGVFFWHLMLASLSHAQIEPDTTLGRERSRVTPTTINNLSSDRIDGGARRGANLFHSFQEFNINRGRGAYFNNPQGVQNILSRVTGDNPSQILGTLGVLRGNANLFLINPNGIVFGRNARLDLQGSFLATTANSLLFDNGYEFSAVNPQAPPLLRINIPTGLQFGETPGIIRNRSQTTRVFQEFRQEVPVGLEVKPQKTLALIGGQVILEGSRTFAPEGRIELGSVTSSGLVLLTPIDEGFALGYERVKRFQDIQFLQAAGVDTTGNNGSGEIYLRGRNIYIVDGSQLTNFNFGTNRGGAIDIKASESVKLIRGSELSTQTFSSGSAGNVLIETKRLLVWDGASIRTRTFEEGSAGNIIVNAFEFVEINGRGSLAQLTTETFTNKNAGRVEITTDKLILRDGGQITSSTKGSGNGATISINASEFIEVSGQGEFNRQVRKSGLLAQASGQRSMSTGKGGDINLDTDRLIVRDGGTISVSAIEGSTNQAGNIQIQASTIELERGNLIAETPSGRGGNIFLPNLNLLRLENESLISATASGDANGGNINIDTRYLIALPSKGFNGNDIIANAFRGNGGNINITAQRIFGIESRSQSTQFNDITASSKFGTNGVIEINTPEFDPAREELPANLVDVSRIIEQNLCQAGRGSQFTVTGRGGLPNSPNEAFSANETWEDWRLAEASQRSVKLQPTVNRQQAIVEAQGWVVNSQGKVVLTAEPIATVPHTPILTQSGCR